MAVLSSKRVLPEGPSTPYGEGSFRGINYIGEEGLLENLNGL
jgi:hypothetical protein